VEVHATSIANSGQIRPAPTARFEIFGIKSNGRLTGRQCCAQGAINLIFKAADFIVGQPIAQSAISLFDLTDLGGCLALGIYRVQCGQIGTAFVDSHCFGRAVLTECFVKEAPRCRLVPLGSEQEINVLRDSSAARQPVV
jgi:hypothetical protein